MLSEPFSNLIGLLRGAFDIEEDTPIFYGESCDRDIDALMLVSSQLKVDHRSARLVLRDTRLSEPEESGKRFHSSWMEQFEERYLIEPQHVHLVDGCPPYLHCQAPLTGPRAYVTSVSRSIDGTSDI